MSFLFDNLIAIVVGTVLLGALLILQQRGQQTSIEAVQRHSAQLMASELTNTLVREIENARGRDETEQVFAVAGGGAIGDTGYRFRIRRATAADGTEYTRQLSFPTVLDPDRLTDSPLGVVTYTVEETGETTFIDGRERPLLRARRFVFPRGGPLAAAGVYERLVDFDVVAFEPDGTEVTSRLEVAETPVRIHLELRYAPLQAGRDADDQTAGLRASTRYARTVRIPASTAYDAGGLFVDGTPGGIPPLPGDDDYEGDDYDGDASDGDSGAGATPGDTGTGTATPRELVVCHAPGPSQQTMTITESQVPTHRDHGDTRGACAPYTPPEASILICHAPGPSQVTMRITEAQVPTHRDHGDVRGECPLVAETTYVVCHAPGPSQQTMTITESQVPTHRDHGDTRGACAPYTPPETTYEICHAPGPSQQTMTITESQVPTHRDHGDTRGACAPYTPPETMYEMCHAPGPSQVTMRLPESEARIHAGHGDTRGACR